MTSKYWMAMAAGLLFASPLAAQAGGHTGHHPQPNRPTAPAPTRPLAPPPLRPIPPAQAGAMMQPLGPERILALRDSLGLSAEQVQRLQALQPQAGSSHHMMAGMQSHREAQALLEQPQPDFTAYEAKLREMANHHVAAMVEQARLSVAARDVLTPAQQAKLRSLAARAPAHGGMGQGGMMHHPGMHTGADTAKAGAGNPTHNH